MLQSDIGVPVYTSKEPPTSDHTVCQANHKYLHLAMSEALRLLLEYSTSDWTIGGAYYAVTALIDNLRLQVIYI